MDTTTVNGTQGAEPTLPDSKTIEQWLAEQTMLRGQINRLKLQKLAVVKEADGYHATIARLEGQRAALLLDHRADDLVWNTAQLEEQRQSLHDFELQSAEADRRIRAAAEQIADFEREIRAIRTAEVMHRRDVAVKRWSEIQPEFASAQKEKAEAERAAILQATSGSPERFEREMRRGFVQSLVDAAPVPEKTVHADNESDGEKLPFRG